MRTTPRGIRFSSIRRSGQCFTLSEKTWGENDAHGLTLRVALAYAELECGALKSRQCHQWRCERPRQTSDKPPPTRALVAFLIITRRRQQTVSQQIGAVMLHHPRDIKQTARVKLSVVVEAGH